MYYMCVNMLQTISCPAELMMYVACFCLWLYCITLKKRGEAWLLSLKVKIKMRISVLKSILACMSKERQESMRSGVRVLQQSTSTPLQKIWWLKKFSYNLRIQWKLESLLYEGEVSKYSFCASKKQCEQSIHPFLLWSL